MSLKFTKAVREKIRARVALVGPPGSGKTYTSLRLAAILGCRRIAVIDTERGSSKRYVGERGIPPFDILELKNFALGNYIEAIRVAAGEGYDALIVDSMSHGWNAEGGALDTVGKKGDGDMRAWKPIDAQLNSLTAELLRYPGHTFCTYRTKNEYAEQQDPRTGKMKRVKIGLAPVFKAGLEYEFDVVVYLDDENVIHVDKSRCSVLSGRDFRQPDDTEAFATTLREWTEIGENDEERIEKMLREASDAAALESAKAELLRATKARTLSKATYDRLVAIGVEVSQRLEAEKSQRAAEEQVS